jgi:GntP family gluconate:H+ symporter
MLLGFMVAIPVSLSGVLWAYMLKKGVSPENYEKEDDVSGTTLNMNAEGSLFLVLLPVIVPIVLIGLGSVLSYPDSVFGNNSLTNTLRFLGTPVMALFIGAIIALLSGLKIPLEERTSWIGSALKDAGAIVIITGAGGAFGNVLRSADLGAVLESDMNLFGGGLVLAFLVSAILKSAQGSSTVAIITSAAIISPLMAEFGLAGTADKALAVLAIGAGALTVSHVNDSYFWVVSQFSKMSVKQALKSHTMGTLFQGVTGILIILLLDLVLG